MCKYETNVYCRKNFYSIVIFGGEGVNIKTKLKSEIFYHKKSLAKKNLTKNLVTFKRWDLVKDEKPVYRRNCLKRGAWTVFGFKRRLDKKERGGVFDSPIRTMAKTNNF